MADLVKFTEVTLNEKFHFLCIVPPYFPQYYLRYILFLLKQNLVLLSSETAVLRGFGTTFLKNLGKFQVVDEVLLHPANLLKTFSYMFSYLIFKIF